MLNGRGFYELRRMAISDDAPKNTASRMLKIMRLNLCQSMPRLKKLISYQDTAVHKGTIYKASGWVPVSANKKSIWDRKSRRRHNHQDTGAKIRWEYDL